MTKHLATTMDMTIMTIMTISPKLGDELAIDFFPQRLRPLSLSMLPMLSATLGRMAMAGERLAFNVETSVENRLFDAEGLSSAHKKMSIQKVLAHRSRLYTNGMAAGLEIIWLWIKTQIRLFLKQTIADHDHDRNRDGDGGGDDDDDDEAQAQALAEGEGEGEDDNYSSMLSLS